MKDSSAIIRRGSYDNFELEQAILDAGRAGDESVVLSIASYLDHKDYGVRGAAIQALVYWMKKSEYFDHAVRMVDDPDFAVRLDALSAVGCIARARPEHRERAVAVLVDAVRTAKEPLDAHGPYEWLTRLGLVPFRLWDEEPHSEVLAAIEAAMGKLPEPG